MHNSKSLHDKKVGKIAFTWLISVMFIFGNFAPVFANSVLPLELQDENSPGTQGIDQEIPEDSPATDGQSATASKDPVNSSETLIDTHRLHFFSIGMPQLEDRERNVIVYLPSDYQTGENSYPVVYVLDAQSLFVQASYLSEDRILNESLLQFYTRAFDREVIIVGIESDPIHVWDEYGPWVNQNMYLWIDPYEANQVEGGEGDAFLDFMEQTLKPAIDERYRTLSDRENTSIAGYKMGGLLSVYAGLTRSEVYSHVIAMSPAVWFAESGQRWLSGNHLLIMIDRDGVPDDVIFSLDVEAEGRITNLNERPAILDSQGIKIAFPQAYVEGTQALTDGLLRRGLTASGILGGIDNETESPKTVIEETVGILAKGIFSTYLPLMMKPAPIPPLITSASSETFTKSTVSSFTITTSGYPVPTISISGTLPAGITFTDNHNGTAKLAGTPTATGTYTLTITAQNGVAPNATQIFTLKVIASPLITSASSVTFTKSSASSFTITTTGYPVPTISISGSLPAGITFTDNHNGTAKLTGTPTATGTYTLTITAQNGVAPNATQIFTLKVIASPLITSASSVTFTKSSASSFTITTSGYPIPTISIVGTLPAGISFKDDGNGTARIYGTTNTTGTYNLTITAQNGVTPNATQSLTIKVVEGCPDSGSCLITFSLSMSPYLSRTRNVSVYLPPNYNSGEDYPVLYLMDAQHMFGSPIAYPTDIDDWKIDELLDSHYNSTGKGVIAVGVWYDANYPWSEYTLTPNLNMDHWINGASRLTAPEGGAMIAFIRDNVKPEIDSRFNTLSDRTNTAIGGGSRCALLALHAGLHAPSTFSKVMAFSTAVWIAEGGTRVELPGLTTWYSDNGLGNWFTRYQAPTDVKYFLYVGGNEVSTGSTIYDFPYVQKSTAIGEKISLKYAYDSGYVRIKGALETEGVPSGNIRAIRNPDGTHYPRVWRNYIIPYVLPFFGF